ncbi:MAG: EFR1 family ferrodoxin, partial [Muribaculaceae bacterium]|nr:EFR1 family ferrodoxin [Muribaculaceae bacterium]
FGMSPRPFRSNEGCIGCGKCAQACPMQNIRMTDSRPGWSKTCAMCLRCYHICPRRAVAYGSSTDGKGQWQGSMSFLSQ